MLQGLTSPEAKLVLLLLPRRSTVHLAWRSLSGLPSSLHMARASAVTRVQVQERRAQGIPALCAAGLLTLNADSHSGRRQLLCTSLQAQTRSVKQLVLWHQQTCGAAAHPRRRPRKLSPQLLDVLLGHCRLPVLLCGRASRPAVLARSVRRAR